MELISTLPTDSIIGEKIMIAKVNTAKCQNNKQLIEELCIMSSTIEKHEQVLELVAKIKEIVPEFISQNSEFEKLDNVVVTSWKNDTGLDQ